ncbi:MAG: acyl-CoA thioesterase [Longimicrobiales bacterium]
MTTPADSGDIAADGATHGTVSAAAFRFRRPVDVRFHDLDAFGHAHHTLPLIYFEEVRAQYWHEVAGRSGVAGIDYLLARASVQYHARIPFPARLTVGVRTTRLGETSFTMAYAVWSPSQDLLATGETVQVMYDYATGRSKPIPADVRDRVARYEQLSAAER